MMDNDPAWNRLRGQVLLRQRQEKFARGGVAISKPPSGEPATDWDFAFGDSRLIAARRDEIGRRLAAAYAGKAAAKAR